MRFAWSGNLYELLFLCFGLVLAPRIFSKLLKVPIALLRQQNILLVIFLHNIPLMGRILEEFLMSQDTLIFLLLHLGFVINLKKSVLKPSQQIESLGLKTDTHIMSLALTEEKIGKVTLKFQNLLSHPQATVLELKIIDRSDDFLNCLSSSACSSTAKVFTTTINTITKPNVSIPIRDSIKQSVKTVTSLVGRKLKIKQWKITNTKGTKFGDTNRFIKIRLGAFCNGVSTGGNGQK